MRLGNVAFLLLAVTAMPVHAAGTMIVVNYGSYSNVEAAANSEAAVNWLDAGTEDDSVCTESFAALELQKYLRLLTGRTDDFPIVDDDMPFKGDAILVGCPANNAAVRAAGKDLGLDPGKLAGLGAEGYMIRGPAVSAGRTLVVVAGGGRVGTLYGVYDLLHRLGCRWFAPGTVHEEIPARKNGTLFAEPFEVSESPAFRIRGFHAWENRGNTDFLLWMARNRMNYWCLEQSDHPFMHKLGIRMAAGGHDAENLFVGPQAQYPYDHPVFDGDEKFPKDPYPLSPEYKGDVDGDGKLSRFEAHPEWYAFYGGKRIPGIKSEFGVNFCTSNKHALDEFFGNYIRELVDGRYRDAAVVRFWTLDAGKWCECEQCKALGTPTDRNLLLVHRLERDIARARADGRINRPLTIRFLIYSDVIAPPTRPLPEGFNYDVNVGTFYPINRCYVHVLSDPACSVNTRFVERLRGWALDPERLFHGQLEIGEYYNVSGFKCLPIVHMHSMAADIPYYRKAGASDFQYMHAMTSRWGTTALTNWQMSRQAWDPRADCDALWSDYFANRYGPIADRMKKFYQLLEPMLNNVNELKYGLARRLDRGAKDLFPNDHLRYSSGTGTTCQGPTLTEILGHARECRNLIDGVMVAGGIPDRIRARLSEDERRFTYGERTVKYFDACARAFQLARDGKREDAGKALGEAKELANLLRSDKESASTASSHANATDTFAASYATGAIAKIEALLK